MINYYLLTKPRIILGNLVTFGAGFLLAAKGGLHIGLFLSSFLGLAFIIASACIFNNYIDRQIDKKMKRTKNRVFPLEKISVRNALLFALLLGIAGSLILIIEVNLLAFALSALGFGIYVLLYSLWKPHSIYATGIGSVAGALPPVIGYCSVSNQLDMGAAILFAMMVLWQMPHFFAIALLHLEDYTAAKIPVLPVMRRIRQTKIHMLIYIIGFLIAACMLTYFQFAGYHYLFIASALGVLWLAFAIKGFFASNNKKWSREMYQLSLLLIIVISIAIPFDSL